MKSIVKFTKKRCLIIVLLLSIYYFSLPRTLFKTPTATVITSSTNELLGAKIAADGQWRFPHQDSVPSKFKTCILTFEDAYFYNHPGFNPISIYRAFKNNLAAGKIKQGGSTITQQVIRLSRNRKKRTYLEKIKELLLATRLEFRASKDKILSYYCSNAPFGGNVVGLDAASWRYFNRSANQLSWAESATLAVLPNAPSLIFPGKNQKALLQKRNFLLQKLLQNKAIDSLTYTLSVAEKIPEKPYPLPQIAPHLLEKINQLYSGKKVQTTINYSLQKQTNAIVKKQYEFLQQNEIYNMAVLVLDVPTRKVIAYVGNTPTTEAHQKNVDIIDKPRSTGSILKPFLYAAMLDDGALLPNSLIADVPTQFGNYSPENFNQEYEGAVAASEALSRSLNIPMVRMLQEFGLQKFSSYLKKLRLKNINKPPTHYGLSLILGGAESNLWDLCKSYAALSGTLTHFSEHSSSYYSNEFCEPTFIDNSSIDFGTLSTNKTIFDAASVYQTLTSLKTVNRPEAEQNWSYYENANPIAWKTGTSFGFRDAWAIGVTSKYVVGVWVGNADGEGRPGLVGVKTAAPILFNVFNTLPKSNWFSVPYDEMVSASLCSKSGYKANRYCESVVEEFIPKAGLKTKACSYHQLVHLDENEDYQVNTSCEAISKIKNKSWFVLPPLMAYYFKKKNPFYTSLPPVRTDCLVTAEKQMEFIYPKEKSTVLLPTDFNGKTNELILKVAHNKADAILYWYIDETYIGATQHIHHLAIVPKPGKHMVTVVDNTGATLQKVITVKE